MKRPAIRKSAELLIFILLLVGCIGALVPVSRELDRVLEGYRDALLADAEAATGLRFSYESMSPSVFKSISVKNFVVSDASNGSVIAEFASVTLSASLPALIQRDVSRAIRAVSVTNGSVKLDAVRNQNAIRLLRSLAAGYGKNAGKERTQGRGLLDSKSLTVSIKNVDIGYSDLTQDISAHITRGTAALDGKGIGFDLQSRLRYDRPSLARPGAIVAGVTIKGTVNRALDEGSSTLVVKSLESGLFSVSRLALVTSYRSGILYVSSVQDLEPVDVSLEWNVAKRDIGAKLECERLLPLRWISIKKADPRIAGLKDLVLSGRAQARYAPGTGLRYEVDIDSEVPESFYSGGTARVSLDGTSDAVQVRALSLKGRNYDIDFKGSFDIARKLPEGFLSVKRLVLPSGASFAGDVYVQRGENGFSCLAPTLAVNEASFSSVTVSATTRKGVTDLAFSALDSSGRMSAEASITADGDERFLQGYATFDSIGASDLFRAVSGFSPRGADSRARTAASLSSYAITTEVYLASDLKSVSFNCPRLVFASAREKGLVFLCSVKGNEAGVDVSEIRADYGSYSLAGELSAGFDRQGGIILNASLNLNDIPYSFNGMYSLGSLSLYGDYGLAATAVTDDFGGITGTFGVDGFPIPAGSALLSCTIRSRFNYGPQSGWRMTIDEGTVEDVQKKLPLSSVMRFNGTLGGNGVYLENVSIVDAHSSVSGYAGLGISDDGMNRQYTAEIRLESPDKTELFRLNGQMRDQVIVDESDGRYSFTDRYFEASLEAKAIPLMRFVPGQQAEDLATVNANISGTPDNLMISADVASLKVRAGDFDVDSRGKFLLEDGTLSLYDAAASWNGNVFTDIAATYALAEGKASSSALYSGIIGRSPITAGFSLDAVFDAESPRSIKELTRKFTVGAKLANLRWKSIAPVEPVEATFVHEPGITAIYAGKNDAITGYLLDDGSFSLQSTGEMPVRFNAQGSVANSEISIAVNDVRVDMPKLWPLTGLGIVSFVSGSVDGDLTITGLLNDPEFAGSLIATNVVVVAPDFLKDSYGPTSFEIKADGKTLTITDLAISGKEGSILASATAEFDRWFPSSVHLLAKTVPGKPLRVDTENRYFKAKGYGSCDLDMTFTRTLNEVSGDITFEKGAFAIVFSGFLNQDSTTPLSRRRDNLVNLNLHVGQKVEFRWPNDSFPILRGLIQAEKPLQISLDSVNRNFQLKGQAVLRGGEIYYIKRSFYLRDGNISFNENQDIFDPIITLRAEIRERDADGEPCRIILSVNKQPLSSFVPVLTSEPVKSDAELMALLGQAASGDTSRDTLFQNAAISASDIFTRMSVFRNVENGIRDALNLDIFSIRTLLLQNAILGANMQGSTDRKMTVGNYFDNTTVYMGKYLGSAIYADALLHFSYYDPKTEQKTASGQAVYGNLLFQPELGFEVTTPFFLLRWGITPESPETLFVTDNTITLSWKFSY